jgi:hypothetical protein
MNGAFQADIDAIGRINAAPTILDVICRRTDMGFAAPPASPRTVGSPARFSTTSISAFSPAAN